MARAQGARALMALAFETTWNAARGRLHPHTLRQPVARRGAAAPELGVAGLRPRSAGADQGCGDGRRRCRGAGSLREFLAKSWKLSLARNSIRDTSRAGLPQPMHLGATVRFPPHMSVVLRPQRNTEPKRRTFAPSAEQTVAVRTMGWVLFRSGMNLLDARVGHASEKPAW